MSEFGGGLELRDVLAKPDTVQAVPKGTIRQVYADGTVDLATGEGVAKGCLVAAWYAPRTGDVVRYARCDQATLMVLGTVRTWNETTVDVDKAVSLAWNVNPAPVSIPNPLVVNAVATKSFRGGDWERDQVYQGAYTTRYGYWYGLYFYGAGAFDALRGRRITSASIRICRSNEGGVIADVPAIVAPHIHPTQPGSAPYFTMGGRTIGSSDRNTAVEMGLPLDMAQQLADGKAAGIGHNYSGTAEYSILDSLAMDPTSGRLTLGWA